MTVPSNVSSVWPQHPVLQYCFISCFSTSQFNFILTLFSSLILTLGTYLFKTFLNQITNIFSTLFCIRGNVIHCHRCLSRNMTTLFFLPGLIVVTRRYCGLHVSTAEYCYHGRRYDLHCLNIESSVFCGFFFFVLYEITKPSTTSYWGYAAVLKKV